MTDYSDLIQPDKGQDARTIHLVDKKSYSEWLKGRSAREQGFFLKAPASVVGAGELQVDGFGLVRRHPAWAVFSGGRSRPALDGALLPDAGTP